MEQKAVSESQPKTQPTAKMSLAEPKLFLASMKAIKALINEATFRLNKDGISLIAMDPANVAMVVFKFNGSNFIEYKVDEEFEATVNMANLTQMFSRVGPKDILRLEVDHQMRINTTGSYSRTFTLPLIEAENKPQKIPDLKFSAQIKTKSSMLNEAIEDIDIVAEACSFVVDNGRFSVIGEGDISKARSDFVKDTTVDSTGNAKTKFAIEYLKHMMSGGKVSDDVVINVSQDYPLRLDFNTDKMTMQFILAPRVEQN